MRFGEPHPFLERGSSTRLSTSGQKSEKGDRVEEVIGYYTRTWIDCLSEM